MFSIFAPKVNAGELFSLMWTKNTAQTVCSIAVGDINSDGENEVVYSDWTGTVYAVDSSGNLLWTYPTGWYGKIRIGDLQGDGKQEVVVASADRKIYCLDGATGNLLWSYATVSLAGHGDLVLADVNGDGTLEIVTGEWDSNVYVSSSANVYVVDFVGNLVWKYTAAEDVVPTASDVDNDGKAEVVAYYGRPQLVSTGYLFMFTAAGQIKWSVSIPGCAWMIPLIADVNNDGVKEVVTCRSSDNAILVYRSSDGYLLKTVMQNYGRLWEGDVVDLENDGVFEFVTISGSIVHVLDLNGNMIWQASVSGDVDTMVFADLDNDGYEEFVVGSAGTLSVISSQGVVEWTTTMQHIVGNIVAADITGDGLLDIIAGTRLPWPNETNPEVVSAYKNMGGAVQEDHNVAITWIRLNEVWGRWWREADSSTVEVKKGQTVRVTVIARNKGTFAEDFYVKLYIEDLDLTPTKSVCVKETFVTLPIGEFTFLWMDWDTSKAEFSVNHLYRMWAEAELSNDKDKSDNVLFLDYKIRILSVLPKDWNLAPKHRNDGYTIEWEFPDNFQEDGSAAHNHRRNKPFYAMAVWDNNNLRRDQYFDGTAYRLIWGNWKDTTFEELTAPWYFYYGHGFIKASSPLLYYFEDSFPENAREDARRAFEAWSMLRDPANDRLATGIYFQETSVTDKIHPEKEADIILCWRELEEGNIGGVLNPKPVMGTDRYYLNITMSDRYILFWELEKFPIAPVRWWFGDPSKMPEGFVIQDMCYYFPFYSTILHEIGHVLGLAHTNPNQFSQDGKEEVMFQPRGQDAAGSRGAYEIAGESRESS